LNADQGRPRDHPVHLTETIRQPQPRKFVRIPVIQWKLVPIEELEYYTCSAQYSVSSGTEVPAQGYGFIDHRNEAHSTARPNTNPVLPDFAATRSESDNLPTNRYIPASEVEREINPNRPWPPRMPTRDGYVDQMYPGSALEFVLNRNVTDDGPPSVPFHRIADERDPVVGRPITRKDAGSFGAIREPIFLADENVGQKTTCKSYDPLGIPEPSLRGHRVPFGVLHDTYNTNQASVPPRITRKISGMERLRKKAPPTLPLHNHQAQCNFFKDDELAMVDATNGYSDSDMGDVRQPSRTDVVAGSRVHSPPSYVQLHRDEIIVPNAPIQRTIPLPISPPSGNVSKNYHEIGPTDGVAASPSPRPGHRDRSRHFLDAIRYVVPTTPERWAGQHERR
jgi:hypothetical protein